MSERLAPLPLPFPIADTEAGPTLSYDKSTLKLELTDYQGVRWLAVFNDVGFFAYASIDADARVLRDDAAYQVEGSALLSSLTAVGDFAAHDRPLHWIICFNETGHFLEIAFLKVEISPEGGGRSSAARTRAGAVLDR